MSEITLSGTLLCRTADELRAVQDHLPRHVALTRAEVGCVSFEVVQDATDPYRWQVRERFVDAAAFAAHQQRVADSEWGRRTAGIERDYTVAGL